MGKKLGEVDDCFSWPLSLGSHCCLPSLDCGVAVVLGAMQEVILQGEAESNFCITNAINPSQLTMLSYVYQKHTDVLALKKKDGLGLLFLYPLFFFHCPFFFFGSLLFSLAVEAIFLFTCNVTR